MTRRVMYLDCFSGAAGDMMLGALIDAGLPVADLERALGSLTVGYELRVSRVVRAGLSATHVQVVDTRAHQAPTRAHAHPHTHAHGHHHDDDERSEATQHHHHEAGAHTHAHSDEHPHAHGGDGHRTLAEIAHLIDHSALTPVGKSRAKTLFRRLGEAEAAIHNVPLEQVHLHEVGALDSIIDIVGAVFGLEWFGIDDIVASPVNVGGGTVEIAHGRYPVPAPATARLLTGVPVYSAGPKVELLTPTGALLISDYANTYGALPAMRIERVGYGAGTKDFPDVPNVLRLVIGERTEEPAGSDAGTILKIECDVDDMNPQLFGPAMDHLFAAGALDVLLTAVQMKKSRPGTLVTVLAPEERRQAICDVLFRDTTTIGVRFARMQREILSREFAEVQVSGRRIRIKIARQHGEILNAAPEFDDCLEVAQATGRPVKLVQTEAMQAWSRTRETAGPA